jgi:hypothetical protein
MNDDDNNFESLRRLLALKRHEIPPPGYFNNFSSQVVSRLRAGEAKKSSSMSLEAPWLFKLLQVFSAKPAFASAFASALCLLLVFGIVFAERPDYSTTEPLLAQTTENSAPLAVAQTTLPSPQAMLASSISNNSMSSLQPVASLFGSQNLFAQQVSFSPGN